LLEHPAIREASIVGIPDHDLGQRIVAFVVLRAGASVDADALVGFVADELSPHKRPREVYFLDELPRNAMGKVQKKQLAEGLGNQGKGF
jgi:acyl-coenzyme A synthetase/AMP-(fatty) acid ligase